MWFTVALGLLAVASDPSEQTQRVECNYRPGGSYIVRRGGFGFSGGDLGRAGIHGATSEVMISCQPGSITLSAPAGSPPRAPFVIGWDEERSRFDIDAACQAEVDGVDIFLGAKRSGGSAGAALEYLDRLASRRGMSHELCRANRRTQIFRASVGILEAAGHWKELFALTYPRADSDELAARAMMTAHRELFPDARKANGRAILVSGSASVPTQRTQPGDRGWGRSNLSRARRHLWARRRQSCQR